MSPRSLRPLARAILSVQALILLACAESSLAPSPPAVARIDVEPATRTVVRGGELQLRAIPRSASGAALDDRPVRWTTEHPGILDLTVDGVGTGLAEGIAQVSVESDGVVRRIDITVTAAPMGTIALDRALLVLEEGRPGAITATVRNTLDEVVADAAVTWESLDPGIATVVQGVVTAHREGVATVRASVGALSAEATVHVRPSFGGEVLLVMPDGDFGAFRTHRMDPGDATTLRVLRDENGMWHPAVSPDGSRLAFTCTGGGVAICVANLDGSDISVLTDGETFYEDQPSWSPDGQRIAFRRYPQGATPGAFNPTDIWVMDADGSDQRNLTADSRSQHWPRWAPSPVDGVPTIAFVQDSIVDGYETSRIALMDADGARRRYLTAFGMHVEHRPSWAPDASHLVVVRTGGEYTDEILRVEVATGATHRFLAAPLAPGGQSDPEYSPNGGFLIFSSRHEIVGGTTDAQAYTVRSDGTDVRRRTETPFAKGGFAWVPLP